jgi:hypothetical protein
MKHRAKACSNALRPPSGSAEEEERVQQITCTDLFGGRQFLQTTNSSFCNPIIHRQLMSAHVDHRNLRMLFRLLVDSLQSSECVFIQYGLIRIVMDTAEPGEDTVVVRKIMEETYDAAFKWFTRARSAEELEKLCSASCHCTRRSSNVEYAHAHERGRQIMTRKPFIGSPFVWEWLLLPFARQPPLLNDEADFREIHVLSRRMEWPRSTTSMLPHGPQRTVQAFFLLFWTRMFPSTAERRPLYTALEWIVKLCHPLIARFLLRLTSMPKRSRQAGWRLDRGRVAVLRVGSLRSLPRRQRVAAVVAASTRPLFTYTRIYIYLFFCSSWSCSGLTGFPLLIHV